MERLLVGRDLQRHAGQEPQVVMTTPLLEGLDGHEKMSKSLRNYVGIAEPPKEQFGKLMSISDDLMWRYYDLLSDLSNDQIAARQAEVRRGDLHPKSCKALLGKEIVTRYHGQNAADKAAAEFERIHAQGQVPREMPEHVVAGSGGAGRLVEVLLQVGLTKSKSEARRKLGEGAVRVDGECCRDERATLAPGRYVLQLGKRRFVRVTIEI